MKRAGATLILVVSAVLFPWWLTAVLSFSGLFLFKKYIEAVLIMIFLDVLYGFPEVPYFTIVGLIVFVVIEIFKKSLLVYNSK